MTSHDALSSTVTHWAAVDGAQGQVESAKSAILSRTVGPLMAIGSTTVILLTLVAGFAGSNWWLVVGCWLLGGGLSILMKVGMDGMKAGTEGTTHRYVGLFVLSAFGQTLTTVGIVVFTGGHHSPCWVLFVLGAIATVMTSDRLVPYIAASNVLVLTLTLGLSALWAGELTWVQSGEVAVKVAVTLGVGSMIHQVVVRLTNLLDEKEARQQATAQQAMQIFEQKTQLEAILEGTQDGIALLGPSGVMYFVNQRFFTCLGWKQPQDENPDFQSMLDGLKQRHVDGVERLNQFIHRGGVEGVRLEIQEPKRTILRCTITPLTGLRSADSTRLMVLQDVTDQLEMKQTRDQLQQAQKMEMMGQMTTGVAHNFSNLLTVILGAGMAAKDALTPGHRAISDLDEVLSAAQRAVEVTQQLSRFSDGDLGSVERIELNDLLKRMESMIRRSVLENVAVRLEMDLDSGIVMGRASELEQIVINIAVNAAEAMPDGGELVISSRMTDVIHDKATVFADLPDGPVGIITFEDSGCGIDATALPHIFEPFFTTKEEGQGSGLGLVMVQRSLERFGGRVDVSSDAGVGTRVRIAFPLIERIRVSERARRMHETREASREPTPRRTASPDGTATRPRKENTKDVAPSSQPAAVDGLKRIVVVDDEDLVRRAVVRVLKSEGFEVLAYPTPAAAIKALSEPSLKFDLIIADVEMPGMTGVELVERIREIRPGISALFMSGKPAEVLRLEMPGLEDAMFVGKPFGPREMVTSVQQLFKAQG